VHFQLVDLPAVSPEHSVPWLAGALQMADAALLGVALDERDSLDQIEGVHRVLRDKRVGLTGRWEPDADMRDETEADDPFAIRLPTLLIASKADRVAEPDAELRALLDVAELSYPALAVSATTGLGLGAIGAWLFDHLGLVRVYTKAPGRGATRDRPFILRRGQTVEHVARLVHKDLARSLKYARVWGRSGFDGQHVGREHRLADRDVVELHT
jgi:ribosome-interacting GTPase 1